MPARASSSTWLRRPPEAARQGVGHIEDQGQIVAAALHHPEAEHVDHKIVVTEVAAPLADQQPFVAAFAELLHHIRHLRRAEELGLFDVDHRAGAGHRLHQIGLAGEESGQLNDVAHLGGRCGLLWSVHICDHRNAVAGFHRLQHRQALAEAGAAIGVDRGAVGLVKGGLEHQRDVEALAHRFVVAGHLEGKVARFEHVDAANQHEGAALAKVRGC